MKKKMVHTCKYIHYAISNNGQKKYEMFFRGQHELIDISLSEKKS